MISIFESKFNPNQYIMPKRKAYSMKSSSKRTKYASKRRSTYRKASNMRGGSAFSRKIKSTILRMSETKHLMSGLTKTELYHNGGSGAAYSAHILNLAGPTQGTAEIQRIGDRYNRRGWKVNLLLGQKLDRPNVTFRVMVVRMVYGTAGGLFSNVHEAGGSGNMLLDTINQDRVKVIYSRYIKKNFNPTVPQGSYTEVAGTGASTSGGRELTFVHKFWIPQKSEVKFGTDSGSVPLEPFQYVLLIAAYDAFGSLVTDNIGYVQGNFKEYYKDP